MCSIKKDIFEIFAKFIRKHLLRSFTPEACSFTKKGTPTQVFYLEYYEVFDFTDLRNSKSATVEIFKILKCPFNVFKEKRSHFSLFRNKTSDVVACLYNLACRISTNDCFCIASSSAIFLTVQVLYQNSKMS